VAHEYQLQTNLYVLLLLPETPLGELSGSFCMITDHFVVTINGPGELRGFFMVILPSLGVM
jgi:hypothetical protein